MKSGLKELLQKIWDEFVYGGHLVAIGDLSAICAFSIILGINITWSFLLIIYLGVMSINYFNRYKEFDLDILENPERTASLAKYRKILPFVVVVSFLLMTLVVVSNSSQSALIFMAFLFSLGIIYTVSLKGLTRKMLGFKNLMTTLPYALLIVFLFLYYGVSMTFGAVLIMSFYFLRIFMNTMLLDIKDIKSDKKEGLKTFVVVLGKEKTLKALVILNLLSVIPIVVGVYLNILPTFSLAILLTVFYAFYYLRQAKGSNAKKLSFMYNVIVDGEFIFWLPYVLMGKYLL